MAHIGPGLKALVIVMGVLIVAGLAVLAVTVVQRAGDVDIGSPGFATAAVALPQGARVLGMVGDGDAITLMVQEPTGAESLVTVDRRTGAILGTLSLTAGDTP